MGFGRKLGRGKGLSALFTGPSGTGKTMAARCSPASSGSIFTRWISPAWSASTSAKPKKSGPSLREAETSNAILFFDEADALFGKRTEVNDAHDRYANIETSYLLQKMEEYDGVVILATNLRENMDEAFTRRMHFIVDFPFPDEAHSLRIWKTHFPSDTPVAPDVDYEFLARELRLPEAISRTSCSAPRFWRRRMAA